jgi:galactokinase
LSYKLAPIPDHVALVIANTMVKHSVAGGDYPTRRRESEAACAVIASHRPGVPFLRDATLEDLDKWGHEMEPKSYLRAKHVISEDLRTVAASEALLKGEMKELGRLMAEAHRSYSQDFEGSCVEADAMVALAQDLAGADWSAADGRRVRRLHDQFGRAERGWEIRRVAWRALRCENGNRATDSHLPRIRRGT